MGEVYRARDTRLDRTVAIKVLPESFASNADRLQRFEQEARVLSALNHPNLLSIYDVGKQEGTHYLVSEFLEGQTLRERLAGRPLASDVRQSHLIIALIRTAFCDDHSNVVLLFVRTVLAHVVDQCRNHVVTRKISMTLKAIQQALFPELLTVRVAGLGDTVGIQGQRVSHEESRLANRTFPAREPPKYRRRGLEALHLAIGTHEQRRQMSAVGITQPAIEIVVFRKEKRGIGTVRSVFAEQPVDGLHQLSGVVQPHRALATKVRLKIRHQKGGRNPLTGDIADY